MVQFLSAALQCAKIDSGKNLLIMQICTMLPSYDSCVRNIFLLLGTWNVGCLDANQVSRERFRKNLKLEDDTFVSCY
ncbi:hypothetical protein OUZ56_019480 [Daphnia magna]|uniref:Uncharacterized protein n=1 Tax=Daphnia magna TaxID=35525 RepID=A0ABQ9ZBP5_9CRUS|nr:hypothetical protein OUZ56_019480 [Daphnia magna]